MGDERSINRLQTEFGGKVTHEPRDERRADMWKWNAVRVQDVRILLTATSKFLKNKSDLAEECWGTSTPPMMNT